MTEELTLYNGKNEHIPAIADDTLVAIAEQAEKRIAAVNKIKMMALKVTNSFDWIDQQGKPYLQVSGAEKIARLFGISWRIDEPIKEDEEGGHFTYTYKGYFSMGAITIEAIGTRASKDGFFKRYEKDANGKRTDIELPPSEIDRSDVKKAAYTNCIGNGITRLLGIRNLSWDELAQAGIQVKQKVEYKDKAERLETKEKVEYKDKAERLETKELEAGGLKDKTPSPAAFVKAIQVEEIKVKRGGEGKRVWTKYIIIAAGGQEFHTFSETIAKSARKALVEGVEAWVEYKNTKFGNEIISFSLIEGEREPGKEG